LEFPQRPDALRCVDGTHEYPGAPDSPARLADGVRLIKGPSKAISRLEWNGREREGYSCCNAMAVDRLLLSAVEDVDEQLMSWLKRA